MMADIKTWMISDFFSPQFMMYNTTTSYFAPLLCNCFKSFIPLAPNTISDDTPFCPPPLYVLFYCGVSCCMSSVIVSMFNLNPRYTTVYINQEYWLGRFTWNVPEIGLESWRILTMPRRLVKMVAPCLNTAYTPVHLFGHLACSVIHIVLFDKYVSWLMI